MDRLTKTDLKALKTADDVYVGHFQGSGYLRCTKRRATLQPFSEDRRHDIPCSSTFRVYTGDGRYGKVDERVECFAHPHGDAWDTIVSLLRAGDELTLEWIADAWSNQYLRATGTPERLHADTVKLTVKRPDKNGEYRHRRCNASRRVFHLDTIICPDNSARMIRGIRYESAQKAVASC